MDISRRPNNHCSLCSSAGVQQETLLGMAFCDDCWTALEHTDEFADLCEAELEIRAAAPLTDPLTFTGSLSRTPRTPPANFSG